MDQGQDPRTLRRARSVFLLLSALVLLAVLLATRAVLLPFVLAVVVAYVLWPLVAWAEQRKVPRVLAVLLVYAAVLGGGAGFTLAIAPRIAQEVGELRRELPKLVERLQQHELPKLQAQLGQWLPQLQGDDDGEPLAEGDGVAEAQGPHAGGGHANLVVRPLAADGPDAASWAIEVVRPLAVRPDGNDGYVLAPLEESHGFDLKQLLADGTRRTIDAARRNVGALLHFGQVVLARVWQAIFAFFITLMLAAYLMLTRERVFGFFESLVRPQKRESFRLYLRRVDRGLSGVVRGQLLICLVNGVLSAIGFAIVGVKFWPVLSLIATVFSIIPIFGALLSSVPVVLFALAEDPKDALFVLVWIVLIHQIEANFLNPKIMGDAAKVHPVLVVFALLAGEHLFHLWGALLAVPVLSLALTTFEHLREAFDAEDPDFVADEATAAEVSKPLAQSTPVE